MFLFDLLIEATHAQRFVIIVTVFNLTAVAVLVLYILLSYICQRAARLTRSATANATTTRRKYTKYEQPATLAPPHKTPPNTEFALTRCYSEYETETTIRRSDIVLKPMTDDMVLWAFAFRGSRNSPYEKGCYQGRIYVPGNYPFGSPSILFHTPNGRFAINEWFEIDSFLPSFTLRTIIRTIRSLMCDPIDDEELQSIPFLVDCSDDCKEELAHSSWDFNNADQTFVNMFEDETKRWKYQIIWEENGVQETKICVDDSNWSGNWSGNWSDDSEWDESSDDDEEDPDFEIINLRKADILVEEDYLLLGDF